MNIEKKAACVSIVVCIVACLIGLVGAQGQQPAASAHVGASAPRSGSATGASAAARGAGSGGSSTWGAGKGSFGYSAQPGGVWRDGTSLGAGPGAGRGTTHARAFASDAAPSGGALPPGSAGAKPTGIRGSAAPGAAHLSHSFSGPGSGIAASGRGSASRSFAMRHAAGGPRGRVASLGRGAGRGATRPSPGLASSVGKYPREKGTVVSSSLHRELATGLSKQGAGR
jgi:23S rRNA pseudouridine2605 synthase